METQHTPIINIPQPDIRTVSFRVVGTTPLIMHRWSEKAKKQILDKHMKKAAQAKEAKDPEQDFLDSIYNLPGGGYGFPSVGFKAAMVRAGASLGLKMTEVRPAFHINGVKTADGEDLIPIIGTPEPREDMVRVSTTVDIRYRAQFDPWEAAIPIRYNARLISDEQLAGLLQQAGFGTGVGEWRPERNGSFGMWEIA